MKMIIRILFFLVFLTVGASAEETKLIDLSNSDIVHILNNLKLIAEYPDYPTSVKIFKVRDSGECGTKFSSCPEESLYIAVSSFDEYPDEKVYVLSKAFEWIFDKWIYLPKSDMPDDKAVFQLIKKPIKKNLKTVQYKKQVYEITVSTDKASFKIKGVDY